MSRFSTAIAAVALLAMAGCAAKPKEVAIAPPPPPAPIVSVYVPPPVSPINRGLSAAATVWHLRAALNVAALACRGAEEGAIIARYNAMLRTHRDALAAAQTRLAAEFRAGGGDWQDRYDDAMTRLYNFFSQAQARDAFCTAAAGALAEAEALPVGGLEGFAAATLPVLDAPFAAMAMPRPVIAVAAPLPVPTPATAPRTTTAPAPAPAVATRAPRIDVDVTSLGQ